MKRTRSETILAVVTVRQFIIQSVRLASKRRTFKFYKIVHLLTEVTSKQCEHFQRYPLAASGWQTSCIEWITQ